MKNMIAFVVGVIFAIGLGISGMLNPGKVKAFLDISGGKWDPSLMFVMVGAIGLNIVSFRFILKRECSLLGEKFAVPGNKNVDGKLILGAILFGVGWGMAGICPGPAIANLASGKTSVLIFFASMVAGALLFKFLHQRKANSA